jgi:hypothetical protein
MDAAAADAEEAAAAAHHEAAQRQAAAAGAAPDADDDAQDMDAAEDGEEADDMEADAAEEGRPSGTTKECMECGEEKVGFPRFSIGCTQMGRTFYPNRCILSLAEAQQLHGGGHGEDTGPVSCRHASEVLCKHSSSVQGQQHACAWRSESDWMQAEPSFLYATRLLPPLDPQAIEDFPRNRRRLDGRDNRCKRCTARMVSSRLKAKPPVTEPTGEWQMLRKGFGFRVSGRGPDMA